MKKIVILLLAVTSIASCKNKSSTTHPSLKDVTQAVYASGKIFPLNDYKVYSKLPGYIEKIHIHVGDSIKVGQVLMTIRSEVSVLNVNTAKNLLDLAQKNANESSTYITALKQDVASAKSRFELDSVNYFRYSNLMKDNAISKVQLDQSQMQFEVSKQNYLKASNSFSNAKDKIRVELENARIQYQAQVSNKNDYTLTSAVNGKVYDIIPKEGELVNTQSVLMEIGDDTNFNVELSVDETDVSLVQKNQDIVYEMDSYKDVVFKGKVVETYPRINQSNKTSKVIASIEIDKKTIIYSGMSIEANIIITEKKNVLVIPREFLVEGNKVKKVGSSELTIIKKGAQDMEFVEILDGLNESDEIVIP